MDFEQLIQMFPNISEKVILESLDLNKYDFEKTITYLLENNKELPKQSSGCAGNSQLCGCLCHSTVGVVFHVKECCFLCPKCGYNIATTYINQHHLHIVQPVKHVPIQEESFENICIKVANMVSDNYATNLASRYGLNIVFASWEDNARNKESSWGPCISDMTLQVEDRMMPVIRQPNFSDLTWDVPMDKIPLVVGNENNDPLYTVTLKEYLKDVRSYLTKPNTWKGNLKSLYNENKDTHVIMSSQTCFLPVAKSKECKFNVALMNYQSSEQNPAVLAIIATSNGTSAQLITNADGWNGQKLYFNNNGKKASFLAQRLSDNRIEKGISLNEKISEKEKQENMVIIIQVPIKVKNYYKPAPRYNFMPNICYDECETMNFSSLKSQSRKEKSNVEHAIIKVGEDEGEFPDFKNLEIERDTSYPVRVTLQYYKATSNGVIDENVIRDISDELKESRKYATSIGSLVVGNSNRPTEFIPQIKVAPWWSDWWIINHQRFNLTENKAKEIVFKNGRFVDSTLNEIETRLFHILSGSKNDSNINWIL